MVWIFNYPHGWNEGGWSYTDTAPSITISNWECNHFIIEDEDN